jgi:hypothetical protein
VVADVPVMTKDSSMTDARGTSHSAWSRTKTACPASVVSQWAASACVATFTHAKPNGSPSSVIGAIVAGATVTAYAQTPYPSAPSVDTMTSSTPSPFTSGAANASQRVKQSGMGPVVASMVPSPSRSTPTYVWSWMSS